VIRLNWTNVLISCGQKVEEEAVTAASMLAVNDIKRNFPHMKANELVIVFQEGRAGKYGDFVQFSVKLLMSWLAAYSVSDERNNAIKEEQRVIEPPITPEEKEVKNLEMMLSLIASMDDSEAKTPTVQEVKLVLFEAAKVWIYDECSKRGWIELTPDAKFATVQAAGKEIIRERSLSIDRKEIAQRNACTELIKISRLTKAEAAKLGAVHETMFLAMAQRAKANIVDLNRKEISQKAYDELNKFLPLQNDAGN
jgi:hypothetical protein